MYIVKWQLFWDEKAYCKLNILYCHLLMINEVQNCILQLRILLFIMITIDYDVIVEECVWALLLIDNGFDHSLNPFT